MKKAIVFLTATAMFATFPSTVIAASEDETVVQSGEGFTVTAKSAKNGAKKTDDFYLPSALTNATLALGGSGSFSGSTPKTLGNGTLYNRGTISVSNTHNYFSDDSLSANGTQNAYWSGSSPSLNATAIYMQPAQLVKATDQIVGTSYPGAPSITPGPYTISITWPTITINNKYEGNYTWDRWTLGTAGRFNYVNTSDYISWQFGTNIYGQTNQINVTIQ